MTAFSRRVAQRPASLSITLLALLAAPAAQAHSSARPESTCFWNGPISTEVPTALGEDGSRFLFPEENATYWLARYDQPPAGSTLTLTRRFGHARHESLNAHQTIDTAAGPRRGFPSDALADDEIVPDPGSTNPYAAGAWRADPRRSYTVTVAGAPRPATRAPNTLYAGTGATGPSEIVLRVYVPDPGRGRLGGTALPEPHLQLADGTVLEGQALCDAVNDPDRTMPPPLLTQPQWQAAVASLLPGGGGYNPANCPATAPANPEPVWNRFFNITNTLSVVQHCGTDPAPTATPVVQGGFYSTIHNNYTYMFTNRRLGRLLVLHGKAPTFRDTSSPGRRVPNPTQVRYWSFCTGEGFSTTATPEGGCVADKDVPLDENGWYTIVISRAQDRPRNARANCGVAWINWGDNGDGTRHAVGNLLNPGYGSVIYRQMLADSGFPEAIKRITRNADVVSTMGDYYPTPEYVATESDFEARGCR